MVERADIFQDLTNNSSTLNDSNTFLQNAAFSYQKLLPTHSQMKEDDDPEKLPSFGADHEPDHVDKALNEKNKKKSDSLAEAAKMLNITTTPVEAQNKTEGIMNNDSFSNLNVVDSPTNKDIKGKKSKMETDGKLQESAIETKEGDASSFIGNKSTFVFPLRPKKAMHPLSLAISRLSCSLAKAKSPLD